MMQTQTAFAEAMSKAGVETDAARLATLATKLLTRAKLSPGKALHKFIAEVEDDPGLVSALGLDYLRNRAEDMRGTKLTGGRSTIGTQTSSASGQSKDEDVGQKSLADSAHAMPASPSPEADPSGHLGVAEHAPNTVPLGSAPIDPSEWGRLGNVIRLAKGEQVRGGDGHGVAETHANCASPAPKLVVPKPNRPPGLAQIAASQIDLAPSILKSYCVRDGRPIGKVFWCELEDLAKENEIEARVLRTIKSLVANPSPGSMVEDLISERVLAQAVKDIRNAK